MTLQDKLFSIVWFFVAAPAALLIAPTMVTASVILFVSAIFLARFAARQTWRCNACGHYTSFGVMPNKWRFVCGETTCSRCGSTQRRTRPYVKSAI